MRSRRRGYTLIQVIGALPFIAVAGALTYQVTDRGIRFQGQIGRRLELHASTSDVVRRVQLDVGKASEASLAGSLGEPQRLVLNLPRGNGANGYRVEYEPGEHGITRREYSQDPPIQYSWTLKDTNATFTLETINGKPGVAWIAFDSELPVPQGPPVHQRTTAAAAIGRGGQP